MKWVFRFYDDLGRIHWQAPLKRAKCSAVDERGRRCESWTSLVHPYCCRCLPRTLKITIAQSHLGKKVGRGLFAADPEKQLGEVVFWKDQYIAPYLGERVDEDQMMNRYADAPKDPDIFLVTSPYTYDTGRASIDGALFRGPAVYCNDAKDSQFENNAELRADRSGQVHLYASCIIRNGQEIFTSYGTEYWEGTHLRFETVYE